MTYQDNLSHRTRQALLDAATASLRRPGKVVRLAPDVWNELKEVARVAVEPHLRKLLQEEARLR